MADDSGLVLELDATLAAKLRAAADAAGRPIGVFAVELISSGLDEEWAESYARAAEYERTGEYLDAEKELEAFRQAVASRARKRA